MTRRLFRNHAALVLAMVAAGACASTGSAPPPGPSTPPVTNAVRTSGDPRIGLSPGLTDAGTAIWNLRLVSNTMSPTGFAGVTNSDLAFSRNFVIQGNYNGYVVWDVTNPARPMVKSSVLCPASQSDVSVYRNLLFVSAEAPSARLDCGTTGPREPVSRDRIRGIRIFDITDITQPKYVHNVQTCRGSHTHTVVSSPRDPNNVYIYISGSSSVRPAEELPGCIGLAPSEDPNSSLFRIEVIRVPLANPAQAAVITGARIFEGLTRQPTRDTAGNVVAADPNRPGPNQCHDITTYPAIGLAGGACGGYGLLLDISDVANPRRLDAAADPNMSYWHSATFSNDGDKILFSDEWGGGGQPKCRATDKFEWGSNSLFTIENRKMVFKSYYKMPAAQTQQENCVAHNGSLIPIPGREVMVQGWYQGGVSIFDWSDPARPFEIAFFDRGPSGRGGGVWSVYWYNGYMYSSEMQRGLDVLELTPSEFLTQNEIDAAKTVVFTEFNAQEQQKFVWPPSFALARAFVDQLARSQGLAANRISDVRSQLSRAEGQSGQQRVATLTALATQLNADAAGSRDAAKVRKLTEAVQALAR